MSKKRIPYYMKKVVQNSEHNIVARSGKSQANLIVNPDEGFDSKEEALSWWERTKSIFSTTTMSQIKRRNKAYEREVGKIPKATKRPRKGDREKVAKGFRK